MSKFTLSLLLFLLLAKVLSAQNQAKIDSLKQILESNISDKERVDTYVMIAGEYKNIDSLNTFQYIDKAIELANKINYPEGKIDAWYQLAWANIRLGSYTKSDELFSKMINQANLINYLNGKANGLYGLGVISWYQGDFNRALEYYLEALKVFEKLGNKSKMASCYSGLGIISGDRGDFDRALEYYFKSLRLKEELGNKKGISDNYNNIASIYYYQENYEKALNYFLKSLKNNKELGDKIRIIENYNNIGLVYFEWEQYEKSLDYLTEALRISQEIGNKSRVGTSYTNIGRVHNSEGDDEKALKYLFLALEIHEELGAEIDKSFALTQIGIIYQKQDRWNLARQYLNEALELAQKIGANKHIRDATEQLALAEKELGNYQAAYEYQVLFKQMADSLQNEEQTKNITRLEMNYEFEQEKDSIQFANEAEQLILEKDIENRKTTQLATFIGLALLAVLAVVLFIFFQSKRRSNRLLTEKTEQLEVANEEIKTINEEVTITNEELKTANESINRQNVELKELNDVKNKLFSIISHDLRGPLGNILSVLELMAAGKVPEEEAKNILEHLKTETGEVSTLFDNLLYWAKSQMEKGIEANPRDIDLQKLVADSVKLIENRAQNKGIQIINHIDKPHQVFADKDMVKLIIRNILHNALKFTPKEKNIYLSAAEKEEFVTLKIQDEGVGMSPETVKTLFQPKTTQLSSEHTQLGKGTGLGLMLSQEFITQNKGEIRVESNLGEGSIFYIQLPR